MNEHAYEQFKTEGVKLRTVTLDDLADKSPRTLLFGYDTSRATVHVYICPTDGQIHVLKYVTAGGAAGDIALMLSHTSGPDGGVERNADFIASKRLYPESCDLEFCRLLRNQEAILPFAPFEAKGIERSDQFNGFAGYLAEQTVQRATSLTESVSLAFDFGDYGVKAALIQDACCKTGVAYAIVSNQTLVAEYEAPKVLAQIEAYRAGMSPLATIEPEELQDAICEEALLTYGGNYEGTGYPGRFGAYTFDMTFFDGVSIYEKQNGSVRYTGKNGSRAVQGWYQDRPYLVVLGESLDHLGQIHVNLYGSPDRFITEMVRHHQLVLET